jgi:hypothetical protein
MEFVRIYFAVVGIALSILGIVLLYRRLRLLKRSSFATGKLVSYLVKSGSEPYQKYYHPIVTFQDSRGNDHTFTSVAGYDFEKYPQGKDLRIRYDASNPDDAFIDSFLHFWSAPFAVILLGIGGICAGMGWHW